MGGQVSVFVFGGGAGGRAGGAAGGSDGRSSQTAQLPFSLQTKREHVKLVGLGQVAPQSELISPEQHK